jgi:hypothetical protein
MTVKELSQLYWLNREIKRDEEYIERLESKAYSAPSPDMSGMPHGSGGNQSRAEKYAIELTDRRRRLTHRIAERDRLQRYINSIPDSLTRLIFAYRFESNMSWKEVARTIGRNCNADSVKKRCYRYLEEDYNNRIV